MDINKRIENIKPFFVSFNVIAEDDASYVLIRVPNGWTIQPITATFHDKYNVETVIKDEGIYFFTEIKNGVEPLFDCADELISYNKNIEARKALLRNKIDELTHIFATASLEDLETLQFVMESVKAEEKPTKTAKRGKKAAKTPEQALEDTLKEVAVEEKPEPKPKAQPKEENNDDNSLMALAKGLTGE